MVPVAVVGAVFNHLLINCVVNHSLLYVVLLYSLDVHNDRIRQTFSSY